MRNLLAYAQLVRFPNTFTAWADILLGALATGFISSRGQWFWNRLFSEGSSNLASIGQELQSWCVLFCLVLASTMFYWSGMIWNDYFDLDQDRLERPGRPLASGRITLGTAKLVAFGLMLGGLLLAAGAGLRIENNEWIFRWRPLVISVLLVIAIFLYDGVVKATWAGPVMMGACRFFNVLLGLSILGGALPFWGWLLALIVGTYVAGVTWFARTEARMSNQSMLIGAATVMLTSLVLALAMPALALETTRTAEPSMLFPYLLAIFGLYLGIAVLRAIDRPDPSRVQPVIKRAIFGLIVLDALMASAFVGTFGLLLAVLLIPGMILGRWLYST